MTLHSPPEHDLNQDHALPETDAGVELIDIGAGRTLEIRPTTTDDAALLRQFYEQQAIEDLRRRFFRVYKPPVEWCREWASIDERGGFGVIAIAHEGDEHTVVAEAGYALRDDGDGDLALMVSRNWRGWLGPYLVDVLARHAASHRIASLQADVMLENRPMLAILRHRGAVNLGHSDGIVRLTIGTTGHMPSWPPKAEGRKLLVATAGGRWSGEDAAEGAGAMTAVCSGPQRRKRGGCPVMQGGRCPLADEAEAIVVMLDPDDADTERLIALHRQHRPGVPIFVTPALADSDSITEDCIEIAGHGSDSVAHVLSTLGSATSATATE